VREDADELCWSLGMFARISVHCMEMSNVNEKSDRLATRESRMGQAATRTFRIAGRFYLLGWLSGTIFAIAFAVSVSLNESTVAGVAIALAFITAIPLMVAAVVGVSRTTRLILERYGLPKSAGRTLKPRMLRSPTLFDAWLADQHATLGEGPKVA